MGKKEETMGEELSGDAQGTKFVPTAAMRRYAAACNELRPAPQGLLCNVARVTVETVKKWESSEEFAEWLMAERERLDRSENLDTRRYNRRMGKRGNARFAVIFAARDAEANRPMTFAEESKLDWDTGGRELWEEENRRREEALKKEVEELDAARMQDAEGRIPNAEGRLQNAE